jgi:hypothetical protein
MNQESCTEKDCGFVKCVRIMWRILTYLIGDEGDDERWWGISETVGFKN